MEAGYVLVAEISAILVLQATILHAGATWYCRVYPSLCQPGGVCIDIDTGHGYICVCNSGWKGLDCSTRDCDSGVYCTNNSTCKENGADYSCECLEGYEGKDCEFIDCPNSVWCVNGGTCHLATDKMSKSCDCYYGWTGDNCEKIDECKPYVNADIVFILDASISSSEITLNQQKNFVTEFVSKFRIGPLNYRYRFALITYSFDVLLHFSFDTYENDTDLVNAIADVAHDAAGSTMTHKALQFAREELLIHARAGVDKYVIVLTDGLSSKPAETQSSAFTLQGDNVNVIAVGVGPQVYTAELLAIANGPRLVFSLHNADALHAVLGNSMAGCKHCEMSVSDVAIVLDVSAHIKPVDLDTQIDAAEQILDVSPAGPNVTHFSYSTFSKGQVQVFDFGEYSSSYDMKVKINVVTRRDDLTDYANASSALEYIKNKAFSTMKGSRTAARKVVVFITSGNFEDGELALQKLDNIKRQNITVVAIGVGLQANYTLLLGAASHPALASVVGEEVYTDVDVLRALKTTFEFETCSNVAEV